jgi:hypothetical protein
MAVSVLLAVSVAACTSDDGATSVPSAAPAQPAAPVSVDPTAAETCSKVDQAALAAAFGPLLDFRPDPMVKNSVATKVTCSLVYGTPTERIPVDVEIQTGDAAAITEYFAGLRGVNGRTTKVTKVKGIGQDAYAYANGLATHLAVHDRTVFIDYAVVTGALSKVPAGIDKALQASARATLPRLTAG